RRLPARDGLDGGPLELRSRGEADLAREADVAEGVGAVRRDAELEDGVTERERVGHERAGRGGVAVVEDEDALAALADAELTLAAEHPLRLDAADGLGREHEAARERRVELGEDHLAAGRGDVGRAADHLELLLAVED